MFLLKVHQLCNSFLPSFDPLKTGWVSASLLISKLKSYEHKSTIWKALEEYGKLIRTIFICEYLTSKDYRRKIRIQLNKGESLHNLRQFLFYAFEGKIRISDLDGQITQANCLNLLVNAVLAWNTVYTDKAITYLKESGIEVSDSDINHISPAIFEHINQYGKFIFNVEKEMERKYLRKLRLKNI